MRLGRGSYPDLHAERLFGETLAPMCSPELLKAKGRLKKFLHTAARGSVSQSLRCKRRLTEPAWFSGEGSCRRQSGRGTLGPTIQHHSATGHELLPGDAQGEFSAPRDTVLSGLALQQGEAIPVQPQREKAEVRTMAQPCLRSWPRECYDVKCS
jgi:hypothetical protein